MGFIRRRLAAEAKPVVFLWRGLVPLQLAVPRYVLLFLDLFNELLLDVNFALVVEVVLETELLGDNGHL